MGVDTNKSNYVLVEVHYNKSNKIDSIKYYSIFEKKFFDMTFALYYNKYRNILPFRNAVLVRGYTDTVSYFRTRNRTDEYSFKKTGGCYDNNADTNITSPKQKTTKEQIDGSGCEIVSEYHEGEIDKRDTIEHGRGDGNDLLQRQFERRYSSPTNSSFIIRNVKKANKVNPRVFKSLFRQARNNLDPDVRWFVSIRKTEELKAFNCLTFTDESTNFPMGYVAVNQKTGDIGALLRDKACEMPHFTLNALANVIMYGGNKLDCYTYEDKGLGYIYAKHGFMPICKVKFDDSKSERAVRANVGRPDIVMFFLIETGQPKDFINDYVENVKKSVYPKYNDYHYIPYVHDLPQWYQYGFEHGMDDYQLGLYIRDVMLEKWITVREKYKGKECLFVKDYLK